MEKLTNINGYPDLKSYVEAKISDYEKKPKSFKTLFELMFSEKENIMAEITDGYKIKRVTYGEFKNKIINTAPAVKSELSELEKDSIVGIYMNNSMSWLTVFWCVLMCGFRPLLLNCRLDDEIINKTLMEHSVGAVISDSKIFCVKTLMADALLSQKCDFTEQDEFGSEVIFMSSGTSDNVKLCAYTGENFFYQICSTKDIIAKCPEIAAHYKGYIRQLMFLPLYHVFGFIAVYLWFGFFSRTFVFLKDMSPQTILNTIRKHDVTHIFAVPLFWDTVYNTALRKIKARGDKTYNRFCRVHKLCNKTGRFGTFLSKRLLSEVRSSMFGSSVRFMISGGSHVKPETIEFFNGIGYTLANGYGMTEVGITSVEMSSDKKIRNLCAVGSPFSCVEYNISENGELLIKTKARAARIVNDGVCEKTDYSVFFKTGDMVAEKDGRYYINGRADDLVICENGENINPSLVEENLKVEGCDSVCLICPKKNEPLLIASAPSCTTDDDYYAIIDSLRKAIAKQKLADSVKNIAITPDRLMSAAEFKISRKKVMKKYLSGQLYILTPDNMQSYRSLALDKTEQKIRALFSSALDKQEKDIGVCDDFFADLGGTSLEYFTLKELIKQAFDTELDDSADNPTTIKAFREFLLK